MKKIFWLLFSLSLIGFQNCAHNQTTDDKASIKELEIANLKDVIKESKKAQNLRSLLVYNNGSIIIEEYFESYSKDSLDHLRSATKSIMSTLIGIAFDKGFIENLDESIVQYLGDKAKGKENITIKHLLSMTSGLDWDEGIGYNDNNEMVDSGEPLNYLMKKPVVHTPGTEWNYSTGDIHLLSIILTEATGMNTFNFAQKYLFKPMGIRSVKLQKFGDGYYSGGSRMQLKPRDMLAIGLMYKKGGVYQGKRILSEEFIQMATSMQNPESDFHDAEAGFGYGYGWWVGQPMGIKGYMASGYGGQNIFVLPTVNLIVVVTHDWKVSGQQAIKQQDMSEKLAGMVLQHFINEKR